MITIWTGNLQSISNAHKTFKELGTDEKNIYVPEYIRCSYTTLDLLRLEHWKAFILIESGLTEYCLVALIEHMIKIVNENKKTIYNVLTYSSVFIAGILKSIREDRINNTDVKLRLNDKEYTFNKEGILLDKGYPLVDFPPGFFTLSHQYIGEMLNHSVTNEKQHLTKNVSLTSFLPELIIDWNNSLENN